MGQFVWVMRDKGSEWRAASTLIDAGGLEASLLIEATCEEIIGQFNKPAKSPSQVLAKLGMRLIQARAPNELWLDLHNLGQVLPEKDMVTAHQQMRAVIGNRTNAIPVVRTSSSAAVIGQILDWARTSNTGLCIRVDGVTHLQSKGEFISSLIRDTGLARESIDLIVDAQDLPRAVGHEELRAAFPIHAHCRTFALVAGTFPASITNLDPDTYEHSLERGEWMAWREEIERGSPGRPPIYGDFATQCAHYAPAPGFPGSPTVRYSAAESFMILRGRRGPLSDGVDYSQYIGHARFLKRQPYYAAPVFTEGDAYVERIAGGGGSGNAATWRVASLLRHVRLVSHQTASYVPMLLRANGR